MGRKPKFFGNTKDEFNYAECVDLCKKAQSLRRKVDITQQNHHVKIVIPTNKPIGIVNIADIHLGAEGVDYDAWERDHKLLHETDRLFGCFWGDLIQGMVDFPTKQPVVQQVLPVHIQRRMLKEIYNKLADKHKILAWGWGNHDWEFMERLLGDSIQDMLQHPSKPPIFGGQAVIELKVGKITYTIAASHKVKASSRTNPTAGARRLFQDWFPADICITAHEHSPAISMQRMLPKARELGYGVGGDVVLIKTGSYQTHCTFGDRYFNEGCIGTPTVILYPDRKQMLPLSNIADAAEYLKHI